MISLDRLVVVCRKMAVAGLFVRRKPFGGSYLVTFGSRSSALYIQLKENGGRCVGGKKQGNG